MESDLDAAVEAAGVRAGLERATRFNVDLTNLNSKSNEYKFNLVPAPAIGVDFGMRSWGEKNGAGGTPQRGIERMHTSMVASEACGTIEPVR